MRAMRSALRLREQTLAAATRALRSRSPATVLELLRQRYAGLPERLTQAWIQAARHRSERLVAASRQLNAVSPLATMQRGYAVLRRPVTGEVVGSVTQVTPGLQLEALLSDGRLDLTVERSTPAEVPTDIGVS